MGWEYIFEDTLSAYAQRLVKSIFHKEPHMAQSDNFYSKPTSVLWVCTALKQGRTITHKDEMREIGAWRLGAVIHRLKREFGWSIDVEYRGPERVAHYALNPDVDQSKLRFPRSAKALGENGGLA